MSRSPNSELNVGVAVGGGDVLLDQLPLHHADRPVRIEIAVGKHPADTRQNSGKAQPAVVRMEPSTAAETDSAADTMGRRTPDMERWMLRRAGVEHRLHFIREGGPAPVEQASGLGDDRFPSIVDAADPVGVGRIDGVAGRVEDREQRVPVAALGLAPVQGDQFVYVGAHPQPNAPFPGNLVDPQQKRRDFCDGSAFDRDGVRQAQVSMHIHLASPLMGRMLVDGLLNIYDCLLAGKNKRKLIQKGRFCRNLRCAKTNAQGRGAIV